MNSKGLFPPRGRALAFLLAVILLGRPGGARSGELDQEFLNELAATSSGGSLSGIVMLAEQPNLGRMSERMGTLGISSRWRRHEYVVRSAQALARRTQANLIATLEEGKGQGVVQSYEAFWVTNMIAVEARPDFFYRLAMRDDVGTIYRNKEVDLRLAWDDTPPRGDGDDAQLPVLPDNMICINVQPAWDQNLKGNGRLIAVFDGGCDGSHQDLAPKWRGGQPGHQWFEGWFDPYNHSEFPYDPGSHGTHVLGIAVAEKADGTKIGVAPGAQWMAAGVLIGFNVQKIISCYQWAVDPDGNPSTVSDVPDVINNSWGTVDNCASTYWGAIDLVEAAGIVNVIAVDNRGPDPETVNSPESRADSPTVNYGVGNVDPHQAGYPIAPSSGRGPSPCDHTSIKPEVTAPGTQIYSTIPGNQYSLKSGCSMAAPHVSGAVAILRQVNPDMPVEEVKTALMVTAYDRGAAGEDNDYGWGIIDVGAAVQYAKQTIPNYPPAGLQATLTGDDVALTWIPPETVNPFNPVTRYRVYRASGNDAYPMTPIAEVPAFSLSYSDNDIPFGSWRYVVTALHTNGESGPTNEEVEVLPFAPPVNFAAVGAADSVLISWEHPQPIKPEDPVVGYRIFREVAGDTVGFALLAELPDTTAILAHVDRDLRYTTYRYFATAVYDSAESASTDTIAVVLPLPVPRNLTAIAIPDSLDGDVSLLWLRPLRIRDDDSLLAYSVYRSPMGNPEARIEVAAFADTADTVGYVDASVPFGSYVYVVHAIYESDTSGASNEAIVDLQNPAGVDDSHGTVAGVELSIEPNPSGGSTTIRCRAIGRDPIVVSVYDPRGACVRTFRSAGSGGTRDVAFAWEGSDDHGRVLSSGTYFVRMRQGRTSATQRLTIVR